MNFNTVTKSGVFQYIQKDVTKKIDVPAVEFEIVKRFNDKYSSHGITLAKYSMNLPLAFMIVANSYYRTDSNNCKHPDYSELVISTGYLTSITDSFELKCTRNGI